MFNKRLVFSKHPILGQHSYLSQRPALNECPLFVKNQSNKHWLKKHWTNGYARTCALITFFILWSAFCKRDKSPILDQMGTQELLVYADLCVRLCTTTSCLKHSTILSAFNVQPIVISPCQKQCLDDCFTNSAIARCRLSLKT